MAATSTDDITALDFETLLEQSADAVPFDNATGKPCGLRSEGSSYVQTIPNGGCSVLQLDEDATPRVWLHPHANAITFCY